jgi:hypothetical protein
MINKKITTFPSDEEIKTAISTIKKWGKAHGSIGNESFDIEIKQIHSRLNYLHCLEFQDC